MNQPIRAASEQQQLILEVRRGDAPALERVTLVVDVIDKYACV